MAGGNHLRGKCLRAGQPRKTTNLIYNLCGNLNICF